MIKFTDFFSQSRAISTHAPHARRDLKTLCQWEQLHHFYSHASYEARRFQASHCCSLPGFYSHASCEARLSWDSNIFLRVCISTHTPLARRDKHRTVKVRLCPDFYSHASCEARLGTNSSFLYLGGFLLTRLLRGATQQKPL